MNPSSHETHPSFEVPDNLDAGIREMGFEKKIPAPPNGVGYVRKASRNVPALHVLLHHRRDVANAMRPAVSVDGEPYGVHGGYVEVLQADDPQKIIDIIRGRLSHYRSMRKK